MRTSLAVKLTAWYGAVFAASSIAAFLAVFLVIVASLRSRTDDDLREDLTEWVALNREAGPEQVLAELEREVESDPQVFFRLRLQGGDIRSWGSVEAEVPFPEGRGPEPTAATPLLCTIAPEDSEYPYRVAVGPLGGGSTLAVGQSLEEDEELIAAIRNGFLIAMAAMILLGGPIGWFLARRALGGIRELTRTAAAIAEGSLGRRVPTGSGGNELDLLAGTFNTMLDRIETLITGMRDVTDNLAHDFRSHLARIRAFAESALRSGADPRSSRDWAAASIHQCDQLMEMIDTSLDIAEAESGAARLVLDEVDLSGVVREACDLFRTVAEDGEVWLDMQVPGYCMLRGDRQRLQRVTSNILDNAIKYTPAGGSVTIRLEDEGGRIVLRVSDTGIGIPPEDLSRIFRRFFRGDRSRSGNGAGLGLSLAQAFVRAHGGSVEVDSTPGRGSTFSVLLPRRDPDTIRTDTSVSE